jgi:ABC-type nitrate/sulfonate/bicarbonate transport system substrate-binding protein
MVAPDSALKSAADLKGKTIAISPAWTEPYRPAGGPSFLTEELKASGLDARDVTVVRIPWEALPRLNEYVTEGFRNGALHAVVVGEPQNMQMRDKKVGRPLFTQTYQAPYNQEYCCLFGIKRALVDREPDKATRILRAFRRAKQWVAQDPRRAVIAAQAAGYYSTALPIDASAHAAASFAFDREVDLAAMLERAFQDGINAGVIPSGSSAKELVRVHYRKLQ